MKVLTKHWPMKQSGRPYDAKFQFRWVRFRCKHHGDYMTMGNSIRPNQSWDIGLHYQCLTDTANGLGRHHQQQRVIQRIAMSAMPRHIIAKRQRVSIGMYTANYGIKLWTSNDSIARIVGISKCKYLIEALITTVLSALGPRSCNLFNVPGVTVWVCIRFECVIRSGYLHIFVPTSNLQPFIKVPISIICELPLRLTWNLL